MPLRTLAGAGCDKSLSNTGVLRAGLPRASVSESVPEPDIVRERGDAREGLDPPDAFLDRLSGKRFGLNRFFERPRGSFGLFGIQKTLRLRQLI